MKPKQQTAVVVIPTYNEVDNIGKMIEYLNTKTFPGLDPKWQMKILVVDGNSSDGTGKLVDTLSKKYNNTYLYTETSKDGIGAAYLKGFKYALDELKADFVFEFDGDFQHPPETIPVMLKAMDDGYDYVIGSRKIKGGSNPKGWGLKRVFFSEVGGFLARFIMFFPFKNFFKVTDPTTGLKITRVKGFIDKINLDWKGNRLLTKSFYYKFQLLYETLQMGAKFKEIPLEFHVRDAGESKIEATAPLEALRVAFLLRWYDKGTQKFLKFGTVGFTGYLVNAILLQIFRVKLQWPEIWSWIFSTECAIIANFTLNNLWTFKEDQINTKKLFIKFLHFNTTSSGALIIQSTVGWLGVSLLGAQYRQIILFFTVPCLVLPYNWLMANHFIWKTKK